MKTLILLLASALSLAAQTSTLTVCDTQNPNHCATIKVGGGGSPFNFSTGISAPNVNVTSAAGSGNRCAEVDSAGKILGMATDCLTAGGGWTAGGNNIFTGNTLWSDGVTTYSMGMNASHLVMIRVGVAGTIIDFSNGGLPTVALGAATTGNLTLTGITGSTQCLQVNTSGFVSGTAAPCGAGGGGAVTTLAANAPITVNAPTGAVTISCTSCLTTAGGFTVGGNNIWTGNSIWTDGVTSYSLGMNSSHLVLIRIGVAGTIIDFSNGGLPTVALGAATTGNLTITGLSAVTQCLQVNASGFVSGTGVPCGSGGGGGVSSVNASGSGISVSPTSGTVFVSNTGVTSNVAGTGISLSASTGAVTITNAGVTSIGGSGPIGLSASTGAVTVSCSSCLTTPGGWTVGGNNTFTGNIQWTDGVTFYAMGMNSGHLVIVRAILGGTFLDMSGSGPSAQIRTGLIDAGNLNGSAMVMSGSLTVTGNLYNRTFSGTPNCSGVANGWQGFDTATGTLWICNGGSATAH